MIDERFSAIAFDQLGLDTDGAAQLADLLAEELQKEMHQVIVTHLDRIIEKLNSMGHNLKPYGEHIPGDVAYRDDTEDKTGYHCKLRVAFDSVISTGYAHVLSTEEVDDLVREEIIQHRDRQTAA
jgi:MoaA/NifB/PqqE/SkfB family radical SAM enzyme